MPALIKKRGKKRWKGVVFVDYYREEKLFPDSSKESKLAAIMWEKEKREEIFQKLEAQSKEQTQTNTVYLTVGEWIEKYLDFVTSRYVKKTFAHKKEAFRCLARQVISSTPVKDINPAIAEEVLKSKFNATSGYAANTVRKNLMAAWTWGQRYMDNFPEGANPFFRVAPFPEIEKPRYVPPEEDFWKLYEYISGQDGIVARQDKVILLTFLHCAGRRGEIWNLKFSDLDFQNSRIRLWTRKRKHGNYQSDWLPLTSELHEELKSWIEERMKMDTRDKQHVFVSLENSPFCVDYHGHPFKERRHFMTRSCQRAGVTPFGFHAIRHLTASILYSKGVRMATIQAILRHENKTTTERYLRSLGIDEVRGDLEDVFGKVVRFPGPKKAV
jgi:integrase